MLNRRNDSDHPWRLRGPALEVAWFVAAVFAAGAVLTAAVDRYSGTAWDSPILQAWTLVAQILAAVGLFLVGRTRNSTAFMAVAGLLGLIAIEEAFHVLNSTTARLEEIARWASGWSDVQASALYGVLIYGLIAGVGLALLTASHWRSSVTERPVIRNMTILLVTGGIFGGLISTLSTMGNRRRWMFVEEFGEAIVFAAIAGYVAGLVFAVRSSGSSFPTAPARRSGPREHL